MVLKTTTCRFSGLRIYPGRGILYIRTDGQQYLFINQKCKSMFAQRKRPAKIAWTTTYRKQHKKVCGHQLSTAAPAVVYSSRSSHASSDGTSRPGLTRQCPSMSYQRATEHS